MPAVAQCHSLRVVLKRGVVDRTPRRERRTKRDDTAAFIAKLRTISDAQERPRPSSPPPSQAQRRPSAASTSASAAGRRSTARLAPARKPAAKEDDGPSTPPGDRIIAERLRNYFAFQSTKAEQAQWAAWTPERTKVQWAYFIDERTRVFPATLPQAPAAPVPRDSNEARAAREALAADMLLGLHGKAPTGARLVGGSGADRLLPLPM